jgi:predicted PurR-regulated permease PerM
MQFDAYDRLCIKLMFTAGGLGSLWVICWFLSIPPSEVAPMTIALVSISAGLRRPVFHLENLPFTIVSLGKWVGLPVPPERWRKFLRIPRALCITFTYLIFIGLLIWASVRVIPLVSQQISAIAWEVKAHWINPNELMALVPDWAKDYVPDSLVKAITDFGKDKVGDLAGYLTGFAGTMSGFVTSVLSFGGKTAFLLVLVFLLTQSDGYLSSKMKRLFKDKDKGERVRVAIDTTMLELGQWANAQVLIGACYGISFGMVVSILGLPFGFTIGLVGFLLESIVPMVGSVFTFFILTLPVAALHGGVWALAAVSIAWVVIFALEWHVIYPLIMGRALKFDAFSTLFLMWIGTYTFGIVGSVLVLPVMVIGANVLKFALPHIAEDADSNAPAHHQVVGVAIDWAKTQIKSFRNKGDDNTPPPAT